MSMNFGRELSLLRIRLTAAASPDKASTPAGAANGGVTALGSDPEEVRAAASDLVATYPQMGRAQMTAFVRTLWQSNVLEMRMVGSRILAARASLLEPADLPFLEGLLKKCEADDIATILAGEVLGTLAAKNKKVWKELRRMGAASDIPLRRAAVRACRIPVMDDESTLSRFVEVIEPMLESGDPNVLTSIDELLAEVATVHADAVRDLAERHGRKIKVPKAKKKKAAAKTAAPKKATPKKSAPKKAAAKKPAPKKANAKKPAGRAKKAPKRT